MSEMHELDTIEGSLLERFHAGDAACFAQLVRHYGPRLLGVARRLTLDPATAEDVLQDTWLAAYRNRATFRGGSLLAWLIVLLRRALLQHVRSASRRAVREQHYHASHRSDADVPTEATQTVSIDDVLGVLERLAPRQREVIVERILRERTTAETARMLGMAEGTVKSTLSQALARLRSLVSATTS